MKPEFLTKMKRALIPSTQDSNGESKSRKKTLDMLLDTIRTTDFNCQELHILSTEINHQYSLKANQVVQHFPSELWSKAFSYLPKLAVQLPALLTCRTVCKSWCTSVMHSSRLYLLKPLELNFPMFPDLKSLIIDADILFPSPDLKLLTRLKELVLLGWDIQEEEESWHKKLAKYFTHLTGLEVLSSSQEFFFDVVEKLTNLRKLTINCQLTNEDYLVYPDKLLSGLTKLEYLHLLCLGGGVCVSHFSHLTSLKTLVAHSRDVFDTTNTSSGTFSLYTGSKDQIQYYCNQMYHGEWRNAVYEGKGSLLYPIWHEQLSPFRHSPAPFGKIETQYICGFGVFPKEPPDQGRIKENTYGIQVALDKEMKRSNWICFFDGEWKKGKMHGQGTYYFKDGAKWHGTWEDGKSVGEGIFENQKGEKQEGPWRQFSEPYLGPESAESVVFFWNSPH